MMKALNDLCIKISSCNRMSLVPMLHHKDRSVPSSCQLTSFTSFLIFPYFSLFSIVTKFVVYTIDRSRSLRKILVQDRTDCGTSVVDSWKYGLKFVHPFRTRVYESEVFHPLCSLRFHRSLRLDFL